MDLRLYGHAGVMHAKLDTGIGGSHLGMLQVDVGVGLFDLLILVSLCFFLGSCDGIKRSACAVGKHTTVNELTRGEQNTIECLYKGLDPPFRKLTSFQGTQFHNRGLGLLECLIQFI